MLKKEKKDWLKLRTPHIEKGQLDWVRWDSTAYSKVKDYLLMGLQQTGINNTMPSHISNRKAVEATQKLAENVVKLLIYMVAVSVTLICWLLLLMPVVLLYVVALPLALNHIVLTYIRTKLYPVTTKLRINILEKLLKKKGLNAEEREQYGKIFQMKEVQYKILKYLIKKKKKYLKQQTRLINYI